MDFEINETSLRIISNNNSEYDLPHLWMRDNCPCNDCRVKETQEKRFMLNSVPVDLKPKKVEVNESHIHIIWPDDHKTSISFEDIESLEKSRKPEKVLWMNDFMPNYFDWNDFLQINDTAIDAISDFITSGVIVIKNAPSVSNSLEELAQRLGPIREVLFERIHNVSVEGHVYNIAHTSLELPPHNDFASYTWPPSVQALHMLVNECKGGRSTVVDGYAVLRDLRDDHSEYFDVLSSFAVPFREFDEKNETYANEPMIRMNAEKELTGFRYSNQLMQMIDPRKKNVASFYEAYHELCNRINSERYKSKFRLDSGQVLLVSAHRILHGREEFKPDGKRHLQDAYYEMDNIENNLYLLKNLGN